MAETDKMFSSGFALGFYIAQEWSNTVPKILLYKNKQKILLLLLFKWDIFHSTSFYLTKFCPWENKGIVPQPVHFSICLIWLIYVNLYKNIVAFDWICCNFHIYNVSWSWHPQCLRVTPQCKLISQIKLVVCFELQKARRNWNLLKFLLLTSTKKKKKTKKTKQKNKWCTNSIMHCLCSILFCSTLVRLWD